MEQHLQSKGDIEKQLYMDENESFSLPHGTRVSFPHEKVWFQIIFLFSYIKFFFFKSEDLFEIQFKKKQYLLQEHFQIFLQSISFPPKIR